MLTSDLARWGRPETTHRHDERPPVAARCQPPVMFLTAFSRAPALQRYPQTAVEPEAIDRRRARERADAVQTDAGPLEAALLQDATRRRIGHARGRLQCVVLALGEGIID